MNISVIIPAFNAEKTIKTNIDAVKSQINLQHQVEVIVVDDGSTDSTPEILNRISGIRVIKQQNRGPAAARNAGAMASTGEILVFTDSDTVPHRDWLQFLVEPFSDSTIMATGGTYTIANTGSQLAELIQKEIEHRHASYGSFIKFAGTYNLAVRESLFAEINGFDESYRRASGEDNDLCYRILRCGHQIRYVAEAKVAHHHPEVLTKYLKDQCRHGFWRARLYLNHPERLAGDSYTGKTDILETGLCSGIELLLLHKGISALSRIVLDYCGYKNSTGDFYAALTEMLNWRFILAMLFFLGSLEYFSALSLCQSFSAELFACFVFSFRAFARTTGFMAGLLYFSVFNLPKLPGYNRI